jgi:hypothetical protein
VVRADRKSRTRIAFLAWEEDDDLLHAPIVLSSPSSFPAYLLARPLTLLRSTSFTDPTSFSFFFFHSVWSDVGTDPTGAAVAEPFLEGVVWK